MDQMKCCYIDCTETFFSGLNTGIQRVVRNVVSRIHIDPEYIFIPVITIGCETFRINGKRTEDYPVTQATIKILGCMRNLVDFLFNKIKQLIRLLVVNNNTYTTQDRIADGGLHWKIISACSKITPLLIRVAFFLDAPFLRNRKVNMQEGDIFFLMDSLWNPNALHVVNYAKTKKVKIVMLVFDMIPVTHPACVEDITFCKFNEYLTEYLKVIDGVISISKYSIDEVIWYYSKLGMDKHIAFDYFHLGADFTTDLLSDKSPDQRLVDLGNAPFFLMVGTIEPRKNHVYVLDAFERLWAEGSNVRLYIVGKIGWKCDDIVKRFTGSSYLNKNLFVFNRLDDTGLKYFLRKSCAVIIASLVEGFGLPVVEAMYFKKTLLASDIPVFREIGGNYPIYFPLNDNNVLCELITRVADGSLKSENENMSWLSWDESVRVLMEKVICMAAGKERCQAEYAGSPIKR
ncbi:MAG: glycosyltransferase family 4 protein [Proteobacteria bacterium]|nr:glycosyltransferase family 4 protein [Pseudomonadota bacterium]